MRNLKITKPLTKEHIKQMEMTAVHNNSLSKRPKFMSREERIAYAESQFEKRTGLKEGAKVRYIGISDLQLKYGVGSSPARNYFTDFGTQ